MADCIEWVHNCDECQKHAVVPHTKPEELHSILPTWPFDMWGIDILDPFPIARGQVKFLLVAVDYFTKWIEAEPLARITASQVQKFVWKNIICRYGIPAVIIADNGKQFIDKEFT